MIPDDQNPLPPETTAAPSPAPSLVHSGAPEIESLSAHAAISANEIPAPNYRQLPEDLRVPWGWIDLALFVLVAFLGTIVISLFLGIGFSLFRMHPGHVENSLAEKSLFLILSQTALSVALLGYLFVHLRVRFELPFWRTIGWRPLETGALPRRLVFLSLVLGGFSLSLLIQLASAAFQNKTKMPIEMFFQDRRSAFLLMLMGILVAPLVEETIFRGYIYPVLARSFGIGAGVVITGTMFGLLHAPQLWGGWGQIALLIVVGIVFTAARAVSRTVVASYLLHVSYNSFLFIAFLVASHGLRQLPVGQ
jgi:membrane protease YdiL (CAAX protease family)